jgi:hypothetical protein
MKFVGHIGGVPVYEDPNAPVGMLYMVSDSHNGQFVAHHRLVGWQYIKARIKRWLKKS